MAKKVVKKPIKSKAKKGDNDDAETPNAMPQSLEDLGLGQIMGSKNVDVVIDNFSMNIPGSKDRLIESSQLKIVKNRKYGLIGRNGIGKSVLLNSIASGDIEGFPKQLTVMHVEQEIIGDETSVLQTILNADKKKVLIKEQEERLLEMIESGDCDDNANDLLTELYQLMDELGLHAQEGKAKAILDGLLFTPEMQQQPTNSLSGGWRMRVSLAKGLFVEPDILLLDEPTNHLDFPAIIWLEKFLTEYNKTLVLVSHDRHFVNSIVTDIILFENKALNYYKGDYNAFERAKEERLREQTTVHHAQSVKIAHMKKFIERFRKDEKQASLVQSRIKELAKLEKELVDEVEAAKPFRFNFADPEKLKQDTALLRIKDITFGYTPDRILLKDVNLFLNLDSRIGVMGMNGVGKSTLIKLVLGELKTEDGKIELNNGARIAFFAQHHVEGLDLEMTPLTYFQKVYPGVKDQDVRNHLGGLGCKGDLALQKIGTLSGGQKSRVAFSILTYQQPHLLILDEPTNHLDIDSIEALIVAIKAFQGGVLCISHDQYFLNNIINEYWAVNDQGGVKDFHDIDEAKLYAYNIEIPEKDEKTGGKSKNKKLH